MPRRKRNARPVYRGEEKRGRHRLDHRHVIKPFSRLELWESEQQPNAGALGQADGRPAGRRP
jgi:hypothetical protein